MNMKLKDVKIRKDTAYYQKRIIPNIDSEGNVPSFIEQELKSMETMSRSEKTKYINSLLFTSEELHQMEVSKQAKREETFKRKYGENYRKEFAKKSAVTLKEHFGNCKIKRHEKRTVCDFTPRIDLVKQYGYGWMYNKEFYDSLNTMVYKGVVYVMNKDIELIKKYVGKK